MIYEINITMKMRDIIQIIVENAQEIPVIASLREKLVKLYTAQFGGEIPSDVMRDPNFPLNRPNLGNHFLWKGRPCWSGAFDVNDGEIICAYPYHKAYEADWHHSLYFSPQFLDTMDSGDAQFFWVDEHGVNTMWREGEAPPAIINRIKEQITLL